MPEFLDGLFDSDFMPHGQCYFWKPDIIWLHVISDGLITLSYYVIPLILLYFVAKRRRDLPYPWIFLMFGAFILACGTTHLFEIWTVWNGTYRLTGVVKALTASISVATAAAMWPLTPKVLALRTPSELEAANQKLKKEIEERRRAQKEIRQLNQQLDLKVRERTRQLEGAIEELEAFSYSVSHDLRAPLRHCSGFVDLLVEEAGEAINEKGRQYLQTIAESATKMDLLIEKLLDFSRSAQFEMRDSRFPLNEVVAEVMQELEKECPERRISWEIGTLPVVQADRALLRGVIVNLLSNAVKFTRSQETAVIKVNCSMQPAEAVVSVQDNGVGFDMRYKGKLFGVFQRLHSNEEFEGTGIGLANVRRIVHRHGGRVWATGSVGQGASFYFALPKERVLDGIADIEPHPAG